jgi:acyl dehydratase
MKFTELTAGTVIETEAREVTEDEIVEFAKRYDPQPFHIDRERAAESRWGGLISSGWMTCSVAMELVVRRVLADSESIGSPGVEKLEWLQPVRPGDRLRVIVSVLESRVSKSGHIGVIRWEWEVRNQTETVVLKLAATSLFDISKPVSGASAPR